MYLCLCADGMKKRNSEAIDRIMTSSFLADIGVETRTFHHLFFFFFFCSESELERERYMKKGLLVSAPPPLQKTNINQYIKAVYNSYDLKIENIIFNYCLNNNFILNYIYIIVCAFVYGHI